MEFIVQKVGMSRMASSPSYAVTLVRLVNMKVCRVEDGVAVVAYPMGKHTNMAIHGNQKKYGLSKEYNRFASLKVANSECGDIDTSPIVVGAVLKVSFRSKGRGFSGVMKRWNFQGGPAAHGSRFHRRPGSIGNREWPGRVQPGKKMPGHYGNELVSVLSRVLSFDKENGVIVLRGSIAGFNGAHGRITVLEGRK